MKWSASNNPQSGTHKLQQTLDSRVDSNNKAQVDSPTIDIARNGVKGQRAMPTEEQELQRNTERNSRHSKVVGFVASAIYNEKSNVSTGSVYGLTGVDSNHRPHITGTK